MKITYVKKKNTRVTEFTQNGMRVKDNNKKLEKVCNLVVVMKQDGSVSHWGETEYRNSFLSKVSSISCGCKNFRP